MPADFNTPTNASLKSDVLGNLKDRDISAITLCKDDPSNTPDYSVKLDRADGILKQWLTGIWNNLIWPIVAGGTGAITAAGARTNLGLGSMAVQNSNSVAITGGTLAGVPLNAADLASGLVPQARLGTGSLGTGLNFLADDQSYKAAGAPTGTIYMWLTGSIPSGHLVLEGGVANRTTYAALFALWGTTFGAGNGTTTFGLPDFRQKFPIGKAGSGTGSGALGSTGGNIDHTHSTPNHSHTVNSHTHSITGEGNHTHTVPRSGWGETSTLATGFIQTATGRTSDNDTVDWFQAANDNTSGAAGTHDHGGATGSNNPTTDSSGASTTGTANPPYIIVNYIVKA